MTQPWHHIEQGTGRPLILLHGIGMSHAAWAPVMAALAQTRRVIAFDLPGFGRTPPLAQGREPTLQNIAAELRETLVGMSLREPVDLVGNSLGGHLALVAAQQGYARSVVALSPGGLWRGLHAPAAVRAVLKATRVLTLGAPRLSDALIRTRVGRTIAFALPVTSRGWRIPAEDAAETARVFASARAFESTLRAATRFEGGAHIQVPVTVAFGTRDWLLTRRCQQRDELPPQTRWLEPRGWGHVPMWDDPQGVTQLILAGAA